jgi:hypothetical protein
MITGQKLLNSTVYGSLFMQVITGLVTAIAVFYKVPIEHMILKDINMLELIVQVVEFCFYIYISIAVIQMKGMTPRRYFDWNITTPTMLFSTILFFVYQRKRENMEDTSNLRIKTVLKTEKEQLIRLVLFNFGMLAFGLMGELGYIPLVISNIAGFICFTGVFTILYNYAKYSKESMKLFFFFLVIWFLYGVAQLFPVLQKNITYNILDIVAKNFYGIFIFYKIYQVRIHN